MKKILCTVFATAMFVTSVQGTNASENRKNSEGTAIKVMNESSEGLTAGQEKSLATYTKLFVDSGMYKDFELSEKGEMVSKKRFAQLQSDYGLTNEEMDFIKNIVDINNQAIQNLIIPESPNPRLRLSVRNFRVYLTYSETKSYLGSAVIAGPIAVVGALSAIGGMAGGPLGTVVCGLAGVYGANYIVEVTKSAINKRRGIWLGWGGIGMN